ncbi:hypothetical protein [Nonomuraea sp. KM88]|uniref:hypothetical protein n=1 Tax=Nonomuraea sp. KM88 TaxID=3457427 RepID=UPI003FCE16AC
MTALLVALCCVGFAVVNVIFELTGRFDGGPYAAYASGLLVMNWLVVVLKLVGAGAALSSIANRPTILPPAVLGVVLWSAFALLSFYALGAVVQAFGMALGLMGSADQITLAGVGYVLFFTLMAIGFGALAISYSRRFEIRKGVIALGVVGGPVALGLLLLAVPMLLTALGVMPAA